jgi:hypothetical protein
VDRTHVKYEGGKGPSGKRPVEGSWEYGNEPSGSTKGGECPNGHQDTYGFMESAAPSHNGHINKNEKYTRCIEHGSKNL